LAEHKIIFCYRAETTPDVLLCLGLANFGLSTIARVSPEHKLARPDLLALAAPDWIGEIWQIVARVLLAQAAV